MTQTFQFYAFHNQEIRKIVSELDITQWQEENSVKNLNFLVIGPQNSGKQSLIRTISHALNQKSSKLCKQLHNFNKIQYEKYQIKKGGQQKILGLSVLRQTDKKLQINAYKLGQNEKGYSLKSKARKNYNTVLQLLRSQPFCFNNSTCPLRLNFVIICLSVIDYINQTEVKELRKIIKKLQQIKVQYIVVGTKTDLIQIQSNSELDQKKAQTLQIWRNKIINKLDIKRSFDVFCLQNFHNPSTNLLRSEIINFYALSLLNQCIQKVKGQTKEKNKHFFNFECLCIY